MSFTAKDNICKNIYILFSPETATVTETFKHYHLKTFFHIQINSFISQEVWVFSCCP